MQSIGPITAAAQTVSGFSVGGPVEGSPGYWKDNGQGQVSLWNTVSAPDWTAWLQKQGLSGSSNNPYIKTNSFTSVFAAHPDLNGKTMQDAIESGQGGTAAQKAAGALVAAYLDASLYGSQYAYTTAQLVSLWQDAVNTNTDAAFDALKDKLEATYK